METISNVEVERSDHTHTKVKRVEEQAVVYGCIRKEETVACDILCVTFVNTELRFSH